MMNRTLQSSLFRLSSELTDRAPRSGARLLDALVVPLIAGRAMERHCTAREERALSRTKSPRRILVLADIHLGDAVVQQSTVTALRDFFSTAEIHYAISRSAACLITANPEITKLLPIYSGGALPGPADLRTVARLCREGHYDLVVNVCPFFDHGHPVPRELPLLNFTSHGPQLLRNEQEPEQPNHFLYQAHVFVHRVMGRCFDPVRRKPLRGVTLTLTDRAHREALLFLDGLDWNSDGVLILINPDTASPFTRPPIALMAHLVERLAEYPIRLLVGEGHTEPDVGPRLIAALSRHAAARVRLVPSRLKVDTYAALTDLVDVFVSGDTGPLHWAAARKRSASGRAIYRNRTFVVSLFGATPARMSGYDSFKPGFLPAWQDAPSITFVSNSPCRNITCLNKLQKTCRVKRCFEEMLAGPVVEAIANYVEEGRPVSTETAACVGSTEIDV